MQIKDSVTLYPSRFLDLKQTTYTDRTGKERQWVWANRPNGTRAVVIAATVEDKLVVTKEYRVPLRGYEWGLPAGLIDPGESVLDAAIREFNEETGLRLLKLVRPISPAIYNSPGMTDEAIYMVFAQAAGIIDPSKHGDSEDIETVLYSRASVQQLVDDAMNDPSIMLSAKAYLVFMHFIAYGTV